MDDLVALSGLPLVDDLSSGFADGFLRDMLDFTAHDGKLVGLRWHFLLGNFPVSCGSLDDFRVRCADSYFSIIADWEAGLVRRGHGSPTSNGGGPPVANPEGCRAAPRRRTKFDSSSSDGSDGVVDAPRVRAGPPAPARMTHDGSSSDAELGPGVAAVGAPENPLCPPTDSRYALEFHVQKLLTDIQKDVSRLYWDLPLFELSSTKTNITDIIVTYCVCAQAPYRQGMHEIVAFLYYVSHRDREIMDLHEMADQSPETVTEALAAWMAVYSCVSSDAALVPCTYALFRRVMEVRDGDGYGLAAWYHTPQDIGGGSAGIDTHGASEQVSGVVGASERVQNELLARWDGDLCRRLCCDYDVHGVTYLIRWLRLLFLRELSFPQSIVVWSALFAERCACRRSSQPFHIDESLALYVATSMLISIRGDLMTDSGEALRHLMHYPPVADVSALVHAAVARGENPLLLAHMEPRDASPVNRGGTDPTQGSAVPDGTGVIEQQGNRLAGIVARLEAHWFPPPGAPRTKQQEDVYIQSIAELKKVRDVLLFGIFDDAS